MKTSNAIKAMSSYPIPAATIENIIDEAGLDADADITREVRASNEFKKAKALTYAFLPKLRTSPREESATHSTRTNAHALPRNRTAC